MQVFSFARKFLAKRRILWYNIKKKFYKEAPLLYWFIPLIVLLTLALAAFATMLVCFFRIFYLSRKVTTSTEEFPIPEGEIYRVATSPERRQRGIAYRLMTYAIKTERGRGLENLFLEVRSKNLPAIKLYTSLSFQKISERKNYYKDPSDDAIVMMMSGEPMVI